MGTLGDRVGVDLMALFGSEEDQVQPDADLPSGEAAAPPASPASVASTPSGAASASSTLSASSTPSASFASSASGALSLSSASSAPDSIGASEKHFASSGAPTPSVDAEPTVEAVVRNLIAELSGVDGGTLDLKQPLDGALDISGLALWAVVAEVERFSNRTFADADVAEWKTPRDIISAAEAPTDE